MEEKPDCDEDAWASWILLAAVALIFSLFAFGAAYF